VLEHLLSTKSGSNWWFRTLWRSIPCATTCSTR
jgi:hypothetical protein